MAAPAATPAVSASTANRATRAQPGYTAERDRLRARIKQLAARGDYAALAAARKRLGALARANGDLDLAQLMQVEHIFATHDDANVDKYIKELNDVRREVRPGASLELREALARVYGNLYFDTGNFSLALKHQLEALDLESKMPDSDQARIYRLCTIAELYNAMQLPKKALGYVQRGLQLAAKHPAAGGHESLLITRAESLLLTQDFTGAAAALDAAQRLDTRAKPTFDSVRRIAARANLQLDTHQFKAAEATIARLQKIADAQPGNYYKALANLLAGRAAIGVGNVDAGLAEMRAAIHRFRDLGQTVDVLNGLRHEVDALRGQGAWQQALAAMQQRENLSHELFQGGQARATAELEARHEAEQRQRQIASLAGEVTLNHARLRAQRLLTALIATLAVFAIGIAMLLFRSRQRARRDRDRLARVVRHDPLTGAFSRYEFQRRFGVSGAVGNDGSARAVLLLDIDAFKSINDRYGHDAGDAALKAAVERLGDTLTAADAIFRWGGDELLLVLAERDDVALERDVRATLSHVNCHPMRWNDKTIPLTVSGGLIRHPLWVDDAAPLGDAIRWADAAMYAAKRARNRVVHVTLTPRAHAEIAGRRPIDVSQLYDWERHGLVRLDAIEPQAILVPATADA